MKRQTISKLLIIHVLLALLATWTTVSAKAEATVQNLRCEHLTNPLGIDATQPRLGWTMESAQRGTRQTAYQILVASTPDLLEKNKGDLWDSGKVGSDQSLHIEYSGKTLESRTCCHWKVRIWDQDGQPSGWSTPAFWTMGLLKPEDWQAQWITASKWFTPPKDRPRGLNVSAGGWADVDLGAAMPIEEIRLHFIDMNAAPKRFVIECSDEPQFFHPQVLVDRNNEDFHPDGTGPQVFPLKPTTTRHVRLRITATQDKKKAMIRQMEVMSGGRNVALMRPTREMGTGWNSGHAVFLVDGMPSASEGNECPPDACPTPTAPLMRKSFSLTKPIKRAMLHVAALGMADVTINGRPVTDAVLGPPFTDYTKRVVYLTHDVTALLTKGENVIGATLGNGFFNPTRRGFGERHGGHGPVRALIQTEIEFDDGSHLTIPSDATWKWARSEIVANDTFASYTEDRRQAKPGWDLPGYVDKDWQPVAVTQALGGKLVSPTGPPIRIAGELKPDRVEGNRAIFKTLSSGSPRVKVNGHAGQTITLIGRAPRYNSPPINFTLAQDGPAVLEPRFMVLSGPLVVEVQGLQEPLAADAVTIQLARADLQLTGSFVSSNPFLNEIYDALMRTHLNYNGDHPRDPMREKQGWTQDVQGMFETAAYLTDVATLYRKWGRDFIDSQDESGYISSVAPLVGRQAYDWNSPWWSGVIVLLPWMHYQYYGDPSVLAESYDSMKRYVDFLEKLTASGSIRPWADYPYLSRGNRDLAEAKEGILSWKGAGDWQNPYGGANAVSAPLMDMPAWCHQAMIVSQTAALLGKKEDAETYAAMATGVKDRFNQKFLDPATGLYGNQTNNQTAQVLPYALDVVPQEQRKLTYQRLLDAIHAHKDHLGTGFVGLPFLLSTLTNERETALANKIVNQQDYPSWKTLMHDGVFAEGWEGGGAQMPSCGGAIGMWLYQSVLGIRPDPAGPGFKKFIIAPQPDPATGLTSAQGSYHSPYGRIASEWKLESDQFTLDVVIPPNTMATVFIAAKDAASVTESGKPATNAKGIAFLRMDANVAVFTASAGSYHFNSKSINFQK